MSCGVGRVVAAALVLCASPVFAQVGSGALTGIVTGPDGDALAAALVSTTHLETSATREAITTTAGVYTVIGLLPGIYRVDVTMTGYQPVRRTGILVETGRTVPDPATFQGAPIASDNGL